MMQKNTTGNVIVGQGVGQGGNAFQRGLSAALEALNKTGGVPLSWFWLMTGDKEGAEDAIRGVREAAGHCPIIGAITRDGPSPGPRPDPRTVYAIAVASPYLKAKVGIGLGEAADWGKEISEAFENSYITGPMQKQFKHSPDDKLWEWYVYRPPSLAAAITVVGPSEEKMKVEAISSFLQKKFRRRVPLMISTVFGNMKAGTVLTDSGVIGQGTVMLIVKSNVQFSVERFHNFEPMGYKLSITSAEGRRVFEFNGKPALVEYLSVIGKKHAKEGKRGLTGFGRHPLGYHGKDGRYHLVMPEEVHTDQSITFPFKPDPDLPFYMMSPMDSFDPKISAGVVSGEDPGLRDRVGFNALIRDKKLYDPGLKSAKGQAGRLSNVFEIQPLGMLRSYLPGAEWEGEAGHLSIKVGENIDPVAEATFKNERLLENAIRLKELNQKVFDGIGYGIVVLDNERNILHFNDTYAYIMGSSPKSMERKCCAWLKSGLCTRCVVKATMDKGEYSKQEIKLEKDGLPVWYRIEVFPLREGGGDVNTVVEVICDITDKKNLQISLEKEKKKMEAVINGMAESVYIIDRDLNLQFIHRGDLPIPSSPSQIKETGKCYTAIFGRHFQCPWCPAKEVFDSGRVIRLMTPNTDEKGRGAYYQITFSPWKDPQGEVVSAICLMVDVTDRREIEQKMIKAEKLNSLAVLSAGMAHELKNPLGAISFNLDMLKKSIEGEESGQLLTEIKSDVSRINGIVKNLLSFSRTGSSTFSLISIPEVIESSLSLYRRIIDPDCISVFKRFSPDLPPIKGNFQDLQQVFGNLITNSVEAMPVGGRIDIDASVREKSANEVFKVMIVGGNGRYRQLMDSLSRDPDCETGYCFSLKDFLEFMAETRAYKPNVVVLDALILEDRGKDRIQDIIKSDSPGTKLITVEESEERKILLKELHSGISERISEPVVTQTLLAAIRSLASVPHEGFTAHKVIEVMFADTGIGIELEAQERIFDPFYTTKYGKKSSGLGLSVVHKILENHSASIEVQSQPGVGSTFYIRFALSPE